MLNAYMGYSRSAGSSEAACLIFAHTGKEAKKVGYQTIRDWGATPWTDFAVKRLNAPHLLSEADTNKFSAGTPHVIESPKVCPVCEKWGGALLENVKAGCNFCDGDD